VLWQQQQSHLGHLHAYTPSTPQPTPASDSSHLHTHVADMEVAESASMSRQRRLLAPSASNDVARTWQRFPASTASATHLCISSLRGATDPTNLEARKVPEHAGGKNPLRCSCPLRPPIAVGWCGTSRGGCNARSAIECSQEEQKNHAGIVRQRFGAFWRYWQ
jgi:hypothetical protein